MSLKKLKPYEIRENNERENWRKLGNETRAIYIAAVVQILIHQRMAGVGRDHTHLVREAQKLAYAATPKHEDLGLGDLFD